MAAAMQGSPDAQQHVAELRAIRDQIAGSKVPFVASMEPVLEIQALEIAAMASAGKGDFEEAIQMMRKSVELAEAMPPPTGPPSSLKPPHELLGEILLRADRPEAAEQHFAAALFRHPDRARSLLGSARAAARAGDREDAAKAYAKLLQQWKLGDQQSPELQSARDYLKQIGAPAQ
jgi:tetratricopeptide (TPR) repeat protein